MANDPIVLLVLGFLLTSVLGGGLAYLFQQRAWRHQYEIQKQDLHHQQALKTFEELSFTSRPTPVPNATHLLGRHTAGATAAQARLPRH
jgi:hypothetical protein